MVPVLLGNCMNVREQVLGYLPGLMDLLTMVRTLATYDMERVRFFAFIYYLAML